MGAEHPDPEPEPGPIEPELTPAEASGFDDGSLAILERRCQVIKLRRAGKSYRQIRAEIGCSLGTIRNDIVAVQEGYKREAVKEHVAHVADTLARIDALIADFREQWERSKGTRTETFTSRRSGRRTGGDDGGSDEARVKKVEQTGNPALARLLVELERYRAEVLGVLSPDTKGQSSAVPPTKMVAGVDPAEVV